MCYLCIYPIAAMFKYDSGILIFEEIFFERCAIWSWMYCVKVKEHQLPIFIIAVSSYPYNLRAMAPPARSECAPIKSGSIAFFCKSNDIAA